VGKPYFCDLQHAELYYACSQEEGSYLAWRRRHW